MGAHRRRRALAARLPAGDALARCLDWCVQNGELHRAAFVELAGAPVGGSAAPRVYEAAGHRLDAPPHVLDAGDPPFSFFLLLSAAMALVAYAVGWRPG